MKKYIKVIFLDPMFLYFLWIFRHLELSLKTIVQTTKLSARLFFSRTSDNEKMLSAVLAVLLTIALSACGGNTGSKKLSVPQSGGCKNYER